MNKMYILNIKKTWFILILSCVITFILMQIIIFEPTLNNSVIEFKTILSFLIPGVLAMLTIYVSGIAIMIGILRIEFVQKFNGDVKNNIKTIINTFSYAAKTSAVLFVMMLVTYLLLSVNYNIGNFSYLFLSTLFGFIIVYTLLFLVQFTVYLVSMIIRVYEITLK